MNALRPPPHADWLVPDWPAPPQVRALCTSRAGGVARPPFDSFHLGRVPGDDPAAVQANRQTLAAVIGHPLTWLSQVHGTAVARLPLPPSDAAIEADACVARVPGVVCTIRVADCLPVLLTDTAGRAVAAAHAGWRGLAGGVLENTVDTLRSLLENDAVMSASGELMAWLGPCIGPQAFEVGADVRSAFLAQDPQSEEFFQAHRPGKWLADLPGLARRRLRAAGVRSLHGNDGSAPWCTVGNPSRFFSHRRDQAVLGGSGRMAASIWLD
ncbi:MAG: peptidoglycan editing factor PgeF [Rhodoferax sp.]|nr:peptidoglycan editing factor PgeF [Rhodoferax sp.]